MSKILWNNNIYFHEKNHKLLTRIPVSAVLMLSSSIQVLVLKYSAFLFNRRNCSQIIIKGTVSVISIDPPFKDGNARFTKVPLKAF